MSLQSQPLQHQASPSDSNVQRELKKFANSRIIIGSMMLITGIALLALGIGLCATGNLWGIAAIIVSLPSFYLGSNTIILGRNIMRLAENPNLITDGINSLEESKMKFKEIAKKDTFGFDCIINPLVEQTFTKKTP